MGKRTPDYLKFLITLRSAKCPDAADVYLGVERRFTGLRRIPGDARCGAWDGRHTCAALPEK